MTKLNRHARRVHFEYEGQKFQIFAGPFAIRPKNTYGIALAEEHQVPRRANLRVPVPDFRTPADAGLTEQWLYAAEQAIRRGLNGERVYVGCFGGIGRTGLMLATIAKILGEPHPVVWTRGRYRREAVETRAQQDYVMRLDVTSVRRSLARTRFWRRLTLGLLPW